MKRLNKILLVFLGMTCLTLYGAWRFIHSEKFSTELSKRVSKILTEKASAKFSFTGVDFSLFPLSTTFKNAEISKSDPAFEISLKAQELEVAFTYSSFLASELQVDRVSLREGQVDVKDRSQDDSDIVLRDLKTAEVFTKYREALDKLPVRLSTLSLEKIHFSLEGKTRLSMMVNQASLLLQRLNVRFKGDVSDVTIKHQKDAYKISTVEVLLSLKKDEWAMNRLKVTKDTNAIELSGSATNEGQKGPLHAVTKGNTELIAEEILKDFKKEVPLLAHIKGKLKADFETSGLVDDPDALLSFSITDADTEWVKLNHIEGKIAKKGKMLSLEKLKGAHGDEGYELKRSAAFFDLRNKTFTDFIFLMKLENSFTNTFLYAIKDSLEPLKGRLSGDVAIKLYDDKAVFEIEDRVVVKDFHLASTDGGKDILKNPGFEIQGGSISVNKEGAVGLDLTLSLPNSQIKARGTITGTNIDIAVRDSKVDMQSLGPIAGIDIAGAGPTDVKIAGPVDNVVFSFDVDWNNFKVVDLNLGKVKGHIELGLKKLELFIAQLDGVYNKSHFSASGVLGFQGDQGMDLKVEFPTTTFSDAQKMYALVFKNFKIPFPIEFDFQTAYTVKGGYDVAKLKIEGMIEGQNLKVASEEAEKLSLNFSLNDNELKFRDITVNKFRGELKANAAINLANNQITLDGSMDGLRIRDFNFYRESGLAYDGDFILDFEGKGPADNFNAKFKGKINNAFIEDVPVSPSEAEVFVRPNEMVVSASLLGGKMRAESLLNFKTQAMAIKSSIDTNDIREFIGVFAGHNIGDKKMSGRIKTDLNAQVSLSPVVLRKLYLSVDELNLKREDINLNIDPARNRIEIDDGAIRNWDLRLRDGKEFISSKGKNTSSGGILLEQKFALKASLLQLVTDAIDKVTGTVKGENQIAINDKTSILGFKLYGDDHALKIKNLPGYITDFDFTVDKKNDNFEISRMSGKYGEGEFKVGGRIYFDDLYPQINLDYRIDKAAVPLFKRSSVLITSNGTLTGTKLPYKLTGKLLFMYGEILEDPADLMKENKVSLDEYRKYLPSKMNSHNKDLLELSISFDTATPVLLKNNLAEVYIKGNGQVTGDVLSPELNTRFELVPNVSKFKFKGHDFALSQGYVEIRDRGKNRISDLKVTGLTKINEYDMKLDLSGNISKVNIDLSSEPALAKEDLLSLLAFGVTSDMSKNLQAGERNFVTTVGIGTLLVDQLKINEDLNSTLGVKLSVQPEFKEDESTLIQAKSAVSEGGTNRLKSATKIKVSKEINKRTDVSLSSTLGGSLEPKQEMNINFKINKSFSLEGIYEMKPSEDDNTDASSSMGVDLKWRKSF